MTLQYLLALPDCPEDEQKPARPTTLARRRKSQTLISTLAQGQEKPMPDLFNLVDLVLTSLQSRNQQTVTATLRLIAVILRNQHQYAISSLIKVQICEDLPLRTLDAHHRDTAILFTFAEALIEHDDLGVSYEAHLQDAQVLLETHCCSSRLLDLPGSTMAADTAITSAANSNHHGLVPAHFIRYDDRLMKALVLLLNDFFANDIGTNLGLTQTFATLASCGKTRLDCWLLREPSKFTRLSEYTSSSDCRPDGSAHDGIITLGNCGPGCQNTGVKEKYSDVETISQTPYSVSNAISPVFSALDSLVKQVEIFRREVQDFDTYLAERRHIFKVGEDIDKDGIEDSGPSRRSGDPSTQSKSRNVAKIGSISERLMSETSSANISRSSSPRGRQLNETPASKLVGHLNQLLVSPSTSPSKMAGRASSPSPLRRDPVVPMSPKRLVTPMGPGDALRQKVKVETVSCNNKNHACDLGSSETSSIRSGSALPEQETQDRREVTLSHLLTNIIILQEFILEIASIMQVRASLFGEVKLG